MSSHRKPVSQPMRFDATPGLGERSRPSLVRSPSALLLSPFLRADGGASATLCSASHLVLRTRGISSRAVRASPITASSSSRPAACNMHACCSSSRLPVGPKVGLGLGGPAPALWIAPPRHPSAISWRSMIRLSISPFAMPTAAACAASFSCVACIRSCSCFCLPSLTLSSRSFAAARCLSMFRATSSTSSLRVALLPVFACAVPPVLPLPAPPAPPALLGVEGLARLVA